MRRGDAAVWREAANGWRTLAEDRGRTLEEYRAALEALSREVGELRAALEERDRQIALGRGLYESVSRG